MNALEERLALEIRTFRCLYCDVYTGRKQALIDVGLARSEWFAAVDGTPGPGRPRRKVRHAHFDLEDGTKVTLRWIRGSLYELRLATTEEERDLRRRRYGWRPNSWVRGRVDLRPLRAARADEAFQRFVRRTLENKA